MKQYKAYDQAIIENTLGVYRKHAGMRQKDVAVMIGHSSTDRISHWEKGRGIPSLINLFRICAIYGVLPHMLYGELYNSIAKEVKEQDMDDLRLAVENVR